jgi:hypothetical protein
MQWLKRAAFHDLGMAGRDLGNAKCAAAAPASVIVITSSKQKTSACT